MIGVNQIRSTFLDFFARNGHEVVASGPLVPDNDPTLMFTNAGMVPFKNVFTGAEARPYSRATTAQKCVRAGGKHNDLENVGQTARHHTFFEMLGNFSFGDYFKEQAISLAWDLVTKEFQLPVEKLLVTVYAEDDEAFSLWRRIAGLPEEKILRISTSDNFWSMGDTGPCGPCSELFYDHGPDIPGGPPGSPDEDGDRFIEFWNLVFMQFEQQAGGERHALPKPSIDTGMGLERIASILNHTHDNYRLDLLRTLIEAAAELTHTDPDGPQSLSHRVIADHVRASAFLISDGVLPANEGRGYVLRRIMRRAMRHAHLLGASSPLMHRLVPTLVRTMGAHYAELGRAQALIEETLSLEETRFRTTLDRGLRLVDEALGQLGETEVFPGAVAFKLYDTFGFPVDLTADVLRTKGRALDMAGFEAAMQTQKEEARRHWSGSGGAATGTHWFALADQVGPSEFLGYDRLETDAQVVALLKDDVPVDHLNPGDTGQVVLNQTPFYPQSGGQVGDTGLLEVGEARFTVTDTQRPHGGLIVHTGTLAGAPLSIQEAVRARVDGERRASVRANHSATHLLHEALRQRLGDHVAQKGSLVAPDRLRFDISHPRPLNPDDVRAVEAAVNSRIRDNSPVVTRVLPLEEAMDSGARALFGEKYDDEVRVVSMGGPDGARAAYSVELCGGTHVNRTGDIGTFLILSEGAVASGVRRVEALTGAAALDHVERTRAMLDQSAALMKAPPTDLPARLEALLKERRDLEREVAEIRRKLAAAGPAEGPAIEEIAGTRLLARIVDDVPPKDLKPLADDMKAQVGEGVVVAISRVEGKASVVVGVSAGLMERVSAVDLVRLASGAMGGKGGGGRPDMAQAGGPDAGAAEAAVDAIRQALAQGV